MGRFTMDAIREQGFTGFVPFSALTTSNVPQVGGIYVVIRVNLNPPVFLQTSPGGHFKQKDPTVDPEVLQRRWVTDCPVIYIGKATNLRSRLRQFHNFGQGQPVGHWGGRYIWQIEGSADYLVAWKPTPGDDPRTAEVALMEQFRDEYGCLPFANISS